MSPIRFRSPVAAFALLLGTAAVADAQATWYVDDDAAPGGDGLAWSSAFNFLQDAIGAAADGDAIRVAGGRYLPDDGIGHTKGSRVESFWISTGMLVQGGYRGLAGGGGSPDDRDLKAFPTLLSGDLAGDDPRRADNSRHVMTTVAAGAPCILDGLIVSSGQAPFGAVGGAVTDVGDGFRAVDCFFTDSFAPHGGAISVNGGRLELERCHVMRNSAAVDGPGISAPNTEVVLRDSVVADNIVTAGGVFGGGLFGSGSTITIELCRFERNGAEQGGGIWITNSTLTVSGTLFTAHQDFDQGGAIWIDDSTADIERSQFTANEGSGRGAGIFVRDLSKVRVSTSLFADNRADSGVGISADDPAELTVVDCRFERNGAFRSGAGISAQRLAVVRCVFTDGFTPDFGSAIAIASPLGTTAVITDSLFTQNLAGNGGGTIWIQSITGGDARIERCTLADNHSPTQPCAGIELAAASTGDLFVVGTILWHNDAVSGTDETAQIHGPAGKVHSDWSCVEGWTGGLGGNGNHGNDPLFVDPASRTYSLHSDSPCIEAGDPAFVPTTGDTSDVARNCRLLDAELDRSAIVDQGAFEFTHVRLDVVGLPHAGNTITLVTTGTAGLPNMLLLGIAPAELVFDPYGTLFLDLLSPCLCLSWPSAPDRTDVRIPSGIAPGPLFLQEFVTSGKAGNLSDGVRLEIE